MHVPADPTEAKADKAAAQRLSITEVTLPPFAWRMRCTSVYARARGWLYLHQCMYARTCSELHAICRPDAGYAIAVLKTEGDKQRVMVQMCALPHEHVILATYALAVCCVRVLKSVWTHLCSRA